MLCSFMVDKKAYQNGAIISKAPIAKQIAQDPRWRDGGDLLWLYIDMNSYFASCEQQDNKKWRNHPLIVVPTTSDYTCAIAASYEAKHLGIKTGTSVLEAKSKIPNLIITEARPNRYVELHHKIMVAIDKIIPIDAVCSIDEFACLLMGPQRLEKNALELGYKIQKIIMDEVGECLTSSVGIAPSRLLAKTAADMKKPLGVTLLRMDRLPGKLLDLEIDDFAGIGPAMGRRLRAAGIGDVQTLWNLSPSRIRKLWGGIVGESFYYALHGFDPPPIITTRSSIGHSHILASQLRPVDAAYGVARRLVAKCGSRLRRMGYKTPRMQMSLRADGPIGKASAEAKFEATSDSFRLLKIADELWGNCINSLQKPRIKKISVTCVSLVRPNVNNDLFNWTLENQENPQNMKLLNALDGLNQRYGKDTITIGPKTKIHNFVGAKIAFNRVPENSEFRE